MKRLEYSIDAPNYNCWSRDILSPLSDASRFHDFFRLLAEIPTPNCLLGAMLTCNPFTAWPYRHASAFIGSARSRFIGSHGAGIRLQHRQRAITPIHSLVAIRREQVVDVGAVEE
jgi:hypothetical protein